MKNTVATGDLVFIEVGGTDLYRIVEAIQTNHLGQVGYRFGCQWSWTNSCLSLVRVGQLWRCRFWLPALGTFIYPVVQVKAIEPTYDHRIALIETEHWSDVEHRWFSLGKIRYIDLQEAVGTTHISNDQAIILRLIAVITPVQYNKRETSYW